MKSVATTFVAFCITNWIDSNPTHKLVGLENVASIVGETVTFTCLHNFPTDSDAEITWYHSPYRFKEAAVRRRLRVNSSEYRVKNVTNGQSISINSHNVHNAGTYTCHSFVQYQIQHDNRGSVREISAHLTIIVSDPVCTIDKTIANETDIIIVECSVMYSGYRDPVMHCRRIISNTREEIDSKAVHLNFTRSNDITTLSLVASIQLESQQQSMHLECDTFFTSMNLSKGFATNVPAYKYTWTSSQIQVFYGARNITVVPIRDVIYPGEYLRCYALGNPEPEIEWINLETGEVIPGTSLHIPASLIRQRNHTFRCRAKNSLSEVFEEISFSVKSPHPDDFSNIKRTISITVPVCIVAIVLLAVLGFMFRKYKTEKFPLSAETEKQDNELDAYTSFDRGGAGIEVSESFYTELRRTELDVNSAGAGFDLTGGTEYENMNDVVGDVSKTAFQPSNQPVYANAN